MRALALCIMMLLGVTAAKVEAQILPEQPWREFAPKASRAFLGGEDRERLLECPTGELVVADLTNLGNEGLESLMSVTPGIYRVGLSNHEDGSHEFLEEIDDYPEHDGPDWTLFLQKIADRTPSS